MSAALMIYIIEQLLQHPVCDSSAVKRSGYGKPLPVEVGVRLIPLAMLAILGQIGGMGTAQAQSVNALMVASSSLAPPTSKPLELVIDTDGGVDDAAAILWLLSQKNYPVDILGFGTVAGNTTVENAANNVLTLLDTVGQNNIPVTIGAAAPLLQPFS